MKVISLGDAYRTTRRAIDLETISAYTVKSAACDTEQTNLLADL